MIFQKFMSPAHLNGVNLALYADDHRAMLKLENIETGQRTATRWFRNREAAQDWWSELPGQDAGKLVNAIQALEG